MGWYGDFVKYQRNEGGRREIGRERQAGKKGALLGTTLAPDTNLN
jgi:hypothetical protein